GIAVQKFPDKVKRPRILGRRGHRCEPDLPVDPRLIRRDKWRTTIRIARLSFEFVLLPLRVAGDQRVLCSLENNFVALAAPGAERAVGVNKIKRVERVVHHLPPGDEIENRRYAEPKHHYRQ